MMRHTPLPTDITTGLESIVDAWLKLDHAANIVDLNEEAERLLGRGCGNLAQSSCASRPGNNTSVKPNLVKSRTRMG